LTPRERFQAAIIQLAVFKPDEMRRYGARLLEVALARPANQPWFAADEVDAGYYISPKTPGRVVSALEQAHLIAPCMVHKPELGIKYGRRVSLKDSRKSAKVMLYQLCSRKRATRWRAAFLRALAADPQNPELFTLPPQPVESPA
jgi:hypothetical protein